ncbi:hypothetical protein V466_29270 [Pseudomonas mandelii PD30]|uniref:Uncharacterized protein n=1 Tax=Pseudomonas mandelii PD30 TaxID=1419583 RepID=A0A059KUH7_9PSED|nr:hypothetical protein [Pseudomonas mandelii]KDD65515.1 hypothetical protein V466_29270 [Pseudomonas mandelii PD30]
MDKKLLIAFGAVAFVFFVFVSFALGVSFGAATDSSNFKDYWVPVLSMIGGWVAGIGTLAAVVVSLWLAHKQSLEDTELVDGKFFVATNGDEDFFALTLVSKGKRPAKVRSVSVGGAGAKRHLFIANWGWGSSALPVLMNYGDDATFRFRDDFEDTLDDFVKANLDGVKARVRILVSTTVKTYEFKLE